MAVHAHPDDESFSTAGTLLAYADRGARTVVVCSTGGEEGEIHDPDLDPQQAKPRLRAIRQRELRCAAKVLKISRLELLGYRDSGMAGTPANDHPDSFHRADLDAATARLVHLIRKHRPAVILTYNAYGGYGHPDHIKVHQISHAAFDRAADPAFAPDDKLEPWQPLKLYESAWPRSHMERWIAYRRARDPKAAEQDAPEWWDPDKMSTPDELVTTRIAVHPYAETIREALRCHRTQVAPDSDVLKPPADDAPADLLGFEHYVRVRSLVACPEREDDVFAGLP